MAGITVRVGIGDFAVHFPSNKILLLDCNTPKIFVVRRDTLRILASGYVARDKYPSFSRLCSKLFLESVRRRKCEYRGREAVQFLSKMVGFLPEEVTRVLRGELESMGLPGPGGRDWRHVPRES